MHWDFETADLMNSYAMVYSASLRVPNSRSSDPESNFIYFGYHGSRPIFKKVQINISLKILVFSCDLNGKMTIKNFRCTLLYIGTF